LRWAKAGHEVAIGSREAAKAVERAEELTKLGVRGKVTGGDNAWCIGASEVVLLSVPYGAHAATLQAHKEHLQGRVLIDITVPIKPPKVTEVSIPAGTAAALEGQAILGPGVKVVAALHHVSSVHLADAEHAIACDVLVAADDDDAKQTVMSLVGDLGMRALDAGPLKNAVALESLTPVLLHLNRRYKSPGAGIRFTF
jgi:NADPH-dependent F420 reductase